MSIAVLPEFQNQKIGFNLVEHAIKDLSETLNLNIYLLEVSENNKHAIKLYQKCNFKKIGLRKNYYPNGDDAMVMKYVYNK